ncbi:hypothetical protein [Streptomyces sp. NPDC090798]|uniref:hypothetical protein n=1 Tax=Streptomyces sp. NPDC090798 TaxID=3365968 RepID=UPI0038016BD8
MTTGQILACAIAWTAALVAITALVRIRHTARDLQRARDRTFAVANRGGVITFDRRMSDAEYEELKARWLAAYGNNQGAHPVVELRPVDDEQACGCWNGVRCVKHCTCHQCTVLRRPATNSEEQPGA